MRAGMSKYARSLLATLAFLALSLATAGDWPTYLHDTQRTAAGTEEMALSPSIVGRLTLLWSYKTGDALVSSASIVRNIVYIGSWDGYEYALDAATGRLHWKAYLGQTSAPDCSPPKLGVSSTATVQDGVVYVGGGDAYWYALDAKSGRVRWKVYTGDNSPEGGHYNWSSPLLYRGYAYIGVASLGDCPDVQGQLLQVDLRAHRVTRIFNVVPQGQVGGAIWSSPAVDAPTNTIYITTGNEGQLLGPYVRGVVALDAVTLAVKDRWQIPSAQATYDSDFGAGPILLRDHDGRPLVAVVNKNGVLYALTRTRLTAGPFWQRRVANSGGQPERGDGSIAPGSAGQGLLFIAGGHTDLSGHAYPGSVRALDPMTGRVRWAHGTHGPVLAGLAYTHGLVLAAGGKTLEALDASTGKTLFHYATRGRLYGAPSISNGRIFVGSTDGRLYAFGLSLLRGRH